MGIFKIDAYNLHWIDGFDSKDDPEDLCLHGLAVAFIGRKKFTYYSTVSSTALYLLKSLTDDHIINKSDNQMLPCCGFSMFPDGMGNNVRILGCPDGIDWTVKHIGDDIILITDDGTEERISLEEYKKEVFRFADIIEDFYNKCSPKNISDDYDRKMYNLFWNEWHRRRNG